MLRTNNYSITRENLTTNNFGLLLDINLCVLCYIKLIFIHFLMIKNLIKNVKNMHIYFITRQKKKEEENYMS